MPQENSKPKQKVNFQQSLLAELEAAWMPLREAARSPAHFRLLMRELGWLDVTGSTLPGDEVQAVLGIVVQVVDVIQDLVENPPETVADIIGLIEDAVGIGKGFADLVDLPNQVTPSSPVPGLEHLGEDLLALLWTRYLLSRHPPVYWGLSLLGLIDQGGGDPIEYVDSSGAVTHLRYDWPKLRLDRLEELFTDPVQLWRQLYLPQSGTVTTALEAKEVGNKLFPVLGSLLLSLGLRARHGFPEHIRRTASDPTAADNKLVVATGGDLGLFGAVFAIDPTYGLVITPFGEFVLSQMIGNWQFELGVGGTIGGFAISSTGVTFHGTPQVQIESSATKMAGEDGHPAVLIGSTTGTRLELGEVEIGGTVDFDSQRTDFGIGVMARKAAMVISGGDGDGFLAKILGEGIRIDFHVGLGYSSKQGVHFEGGIDGASELVITIPIKAKLFGVITFENVQLGIKPNTEPPGVALRLGGTIITELGPLVATVENMGLELVIGFPASGGNAGPMDLQFGFKPPSGVGLSIDAKAVKGGGYLYIGDHRYAGVLQIVILSKISLTAIGIITTKMPDGSDGFGLFILISIEFDPGIQLSMGFSLTGVGGLLGLNRTMNADALRAGARNGTISNILFPKDILANAPEVIASIEGFFPLERGRFVFGPVVKIAWGSPAIVTIEIGLIIEVPSPVRIALPGVVRMALPDPESAILELNISFIGIIDFGEKYISIDASIFDSRILIFTLEGDMAFRLSWGDNPYFLYSMGGFHPAFQPPQSLGLSDMRRLSICIFNEPNLRLKFATYFALTSNTLQMGAGIEFYAGFAGFVVDARAGFDALFYFDPFHMDVALYLIAMLRAGDLDLLAMSLTARLTGPTPWTIVGEASFTLFGNSCSFLVEKTFGEEIDTTMPTVEVGSLLIDGLSDNANWIATASGHTTDDGDGVTLRSLADVSAANPDDIIVHPGGRLRIAQEALPLERTIELLGAETVSGPSWFEITSVDLIEGAVATPLDHEDTQARFAPAQYFEMTQTEKLAAPSFEAMNAGVQMSTTSSALRAGGHRKRTLSVEALWIDQEPPPSRVTVTTGDTLDPVEQERTDP